MLTIDGRSGGGQLLRTALSLSAVTNTPFEIEDVRATRPSPGLKPQHLAVIRLMADICDADVTGATSDSETLTFRPRALAADSKRVDIGTAGSIVLLFDTVLPLAIRFDAGFELTAIGGTDVKWAPTIGYFERVKLPLLRRSGLGATVDAGRTGFYPAGGGEATLHVAPSSVDPIDLRDRGGLERVEVLSKASEELEARHVADRQAERAKELLEERDIPVGESSVEYVDSTSIGSSLLLRAVYGGSLAGFDAHGERGKTSEAVAETAAERFFAFHAGDGAVDEHMGDQLLVFLGIAGGTIRLPRLTDHVRANLDVIDRFGYGLRIDRREDGTALIRS